MTSEAVPIGEELLAVVALQPGLPLHHAVAPLVVAVATARLADVVHPVVVAHAALGAVVVVVEEPAIK